MEKFKNYFNSIKRGSDVMVGAAKVNSNLLLLANGKDYSNLSQDRIINPTLKPANRKEAGNALNAESSMGIITNHRRGASNLDNYPPHEGDGKTSKLSSKKVVYQKQNHLLS